MKTKIVSDGVYSFTNSAGFSGEILRQPEGGWTVYDPKTCYTHDFFITKAAAVGYADVMENPEKIEANAAMTQEELMAADPWAWLAH